MRPRELDLVALYRALDDVRFQRRVTWSVVAVEAGISGSTFSRVFRDRHLPSVGTLLALLTWLGQTDLAPYLTSTEDSDD